MFNVKAMPKILIIILIISFVLVICANSYSDDNQEDNTGYIPQNGFVPNDTTAIKIAEAIWLPIYGEKIYKKKPFVAKLINDKIWVVEGTLKNYMLGGVPYAEIQKN